MHPLLAYAQRERPRLLETLETLVRAESPSTSKAAVDACGDELVRRLSDLGARVERIPQRERGDHVRAGFDGEGPQIMILGHFDTVWPVGQIERMPFRDEGGRLHGPGIYDMKSGIAVSMLAVRALQRLALPRPRVLMLWTTDEEVGSGTSRALIEDDASRSAAVLVLEPSMPDGGAKTSRKGVGEFELVVHGVSAHAGIAPGQGANAVHELAEQIVALRALNDPASGTTVNVTVVEGGTRTNVIPDRARATVDVRIAAMEQAARLEQAIRSVKPVISGTRLEIHGGVNRPPMERTSGVAALYERARSSARALGRDLSEGGTGGGSDGNFTAALGVPTLDGLGPQGDGAHALHEHVLLADLTWRAALVAHLLSALAGQPPLPAQR